MTLMRSALMVIVGLALLESGHGATTQAKPNEQLRERLAATASRLAGCKLEVNKPRPVILDDDSDGSNPGIRWRSRLRCTRKMLLVLESVEDWELASGKVTTSDSHGSRDRNRVHGTGSWSACFHIGGLWEEKSPGDLPKRVRFRTLVHTPKPKFTGRVLMEKASPWADFADLCPNVVEDWEQGS